MGQTCQGTPRLDDSRVTDGKNLVSAFSVRQFYTLVEVTFQTQRYYTVVGVKLNACQIFKNKTKQNKTKQNTLCCLEKSLGINPVVVLVRKLHGYYWIK